MSGIVIVDGNSLINRAFFALKDLRNSKGVYTGGVYGITQMIFKLIDDFKPSHFVVAFDMKGPTFRHLAYDQYKGTRTGMPDELAMQMPITKEILDALKISRIELQGYEADDLIGTISQQAKAIGLPCYIITGDKDALQLATEGVNVYITKKGISNLKAYDDDAIMEEWGVDAAHVIDFKGLSGDSSDNIPGVKGVGPKTAQKLLQQFGTVENLIENVEQVENERIRNLIVEHAENALMSKRLATIHTEVPIDISFEALQIEEPDFEKALELFKLYELTSLVNLIKPKQVDKPLPKAEYVVNRDVEALIQIAKSKKELYLYGAGRRDDQTYTTYVALAITEGEQVFYFDRTSDIEKLKEIFEDASIQKYGFDIKREMLCSYGHGIHLKGCTFDGYIAAYLTDPARRNYNFEDLIFEKCHLQIDSEEQLLGKGVKKTTFESVDSIALQTYLVERVKAMPKLQSLYSAELKQNDLETLFNTVEMPLIEVLANMEFVGFKVDLETLNELGDAIETKIIEIESEVYRLAGEKFNINSPKQLGVILFEKLGLPSSKKTKTGYSTNIDVLEKLMSKHDIVKEIVEYRQYAKLKSTYIDGLNAVVDQSQRVHTSLNQTIAVTGRLSSTEPNLQNIPIRLPYGRKIRKVFTADEGCTLLDADYSQIELRVLAHLSQDDRLVYAFNHNLDIHTITASQVFHVSEDEVTSIQRSRAKEVNFGIVYGMGDFGLSESLTITRKEAKHYIESYFETYPKVKTYMEEIIETCKEKGYVETILNRKREIQDINHSNFMLRSAAERTARNTPIQGSAADIIKIAMIKVFKALEQNDLKSKLILQVHDELILNVPNDEIEVVKAILKDAMESAYPLNVPLKVDMNTGANWYEAK